MPAQYSNTFNTDKVGTLIGKGVKDIHWYRDTERLFVDLFGSDRLHLVTQLFAATSIKSTLTSNIKLFRRALRDINEGNEFRRYLPAMEYQLKLIRDGRPIQARKIRNFAAAMSGDVNAVVVDRWLMRAFGYDGIKSPTDAQYTRIENWVRGYAEMTSREPRQISAMIWSGIRGGVTRYDHILRNKLFNMYEENHDYLFAGVSITGVMQPAQRLQSSQVQTS